MSDVIIGKRDIYDFESELARGGFCQIDVVRRRSDGLQCIYRTVNNARRGVNELEACVMTGHAFQKKLLTQGHKFPPEIFEIINGNRNAAIMELILGQSLKQLLGMEGPFSHDRIQSIAMQIFAAVQAVHDEEVVHADVSTSNFLIEMDDTVRCIDFDLVRPFGRYDLIPGQFQYLAPEIWNMAEYDHRSDLYALGIVLLKMYRGEECFHPEPKSLEDFRRMHCEQPPWNMTNGLPRNVRPIVEKLLSKSPSDRYPSAVAVMRDLAAA